mmetsp:Transcript_20507/g.22925  ORF Transcript_20507/g.22925 Transcript_20507/m.22925 type:complete len:141 (+) Transcript_20507:95-517(+)|eukprot:CAMPEP_0194131552 /NCGR_PEP_ID=MMETSP0152-20130528/2303_1 /TAXON_ID=1049557 /ORGANISM="Thalassiothrix antarctica, Strain L6-D1" /LENGTH=140 /DNA_ID=CAMNT_0038826377 /DNA_START=95 /DNA_END=517 /DNA_ORIENTATION=-
MQRLYFLLNLMIAAVSAFIAPGTFVRIGSSAIIDFPAPAQHWEAYQPSALKRQRKSVASVQTQSLFGLGAPELAVILIAAAFLLGPDKLAELGKDAGKIAGELKEVPKEFQKGLEEGEAQAQEIKGEILGEEKKVDAKKE